jgi:arylsulfatase A-like enzyme
MRFAIIVLLLSAAALAKQPDLVFVLVDDWGFANAGFKRDPTWPGNNETQTPNIDRLARGGLILDRHYVFKLCSPTRSALQTGRNPIHVNVLNSPIMQYNPADPEAGFQGVARSFTGIAEKLRGVGYDTAQVGKWNAGMALHKQTPAGRGVSFDANRPRAPQPRPNKDTKHTNKPLNPPSNSTTQACTTTITTRFSSTTPLNFAATAPQKCR